MSYCSVPLQIWAIHYDFKENDILLGIRSPLQLAERTGFWTCTGHIYLRLGFSSSFLMASFLQIRAIHYDFKEHDIFLDIRSPLQLTEGTEQGAAAGNVHVPPRSLER